MIRCCKCKNEKDEKEFAFRNKAKGNRNSMCRKCHGEYVGKHYSENRKDYIRRSSKNTKKKVEFARQKICEILITKPCVDCGDQDIRTLDFDHNDPSEKIDSVFAMVSRGFPWYKIEAEIGKCTVRCASCHRKRTNRQFDFYRQKFLNNF